MTETREKSFMSVKNPGIYLAILLIGLWILCWIVFLGFLRRAVWAGVPAITWSMIVFGVIAIIVSIIAIPIFKKFENG
jgi:uncharacterized membrane protein